ncbi:MAG: SpoIIE family protein phosphatase [Bacteroidales bacterium]|nr:SpoIIE family protein phosphatase [Bacteroidales bacterium]
MSKSISGELSKKIILAIAILVLGGIVGISVYSGKVVSRSATKTVNNSISSYIRDVEGIIGDVRIVKDFISWQMASLSDDEGRISEIKEKALGFNPMIANIDIIPGCKDTLEKWSEPYESEKYGKVVTFTAPLTDASGVQTGTISIDILLSGITERLGREHYFENSYYTIVSPGGLTLSHPDKNFLLSKLTDVASDRNDESLKVLSEKMTSGLTGYTPVKSTKSIAIYGPVSNGWSAAIVCPAGELFGWIVKFQLLLLLIALGDLILLYFVTDKIISRTIMPLTEITYLAKSVAKGNFQTEIPHIEGNTEMFHLHEALRNMLRSINDYISQLKTTTAVKERFESELSIASKIQQQMLNTDFINDKDVDLFAKLIPAKEVGGDMYDFLREGRTVYFAVGDVSGKGVPAALYMAISRSLFHYVSGISMSTSSIVSCINSSFCSGNENNMFITMFVGRIDLDTRELVFCNAGHNPIVIISPSGEAKYIHAKSNLAAGVFEEFPYEKESVIIEKGSRLLIYTDGVTEAENSTKNLYGEDRLIDFAKSMSPDTPSEEFVEKLVASIKEFTGDNDQNDDITIMSVKV